MRTPAKIALSVVPFFLTACIHVHLPFHKDKKDQIAMVAPPIENTPPEPAPAPPKVTPPPAPAPAKPEPPPVAPQKPESKPKPPAHHRKPASKPVQQASAEPSPGAETPAISAIGQLSSGESSDLWRKTEKSIEETEKGLNDINRKLSDGEAKTADQIREFIKQARAALKAGDVDGAGVLAAKAKVLLGELTQ